MLLAWRYKFGITGHRGQPKLRTGEPASAARRHLEPRDSVAGRGLDHARERLAGQDQPAVTPLKQGNHDDNKVVAHFGQHVCFAPGALGYRLPGEYAAVHELFQPI